MECVYVFKNSSPFATWYKVLPSGSEDADIQEGWLSDQFRKYSLTGVELWKRFDCDNSEDISREFNTILRDENKMRAILGRGPAQVRNGWFSLNVDDIRSLLKHLGVNIRRQIIL